MKTVALRLVFSLLTVTALLSTACGPRLAAPATTAPTPTVSPTPAAPTPAPVTPTPTPAPTLVEKPKYGGTFSIIRRSVVEVFDSGYVTQGIGEIAWLVYEQFIAPDPTTGLRGTGEVDWGSGVNKIQGFGLELAESWEIPEVGTWVLKIRKGVHWALNPASEASRLMNGREFTADDAVWAVRRHNSDPKFPNANIRWSQPRTAKSVTIEKTGPWEVTLKIPADPWTGFFWVTWGGNSQQMWPREPIEKYGHVNDWQNAVGTGAYMMADLVPGSVATLKKNPNYWRMNTVGPGKGDQLPYIDTIKILTVPDISTQMAVMRTGRGDNVYGIEAEDAQTWIKSIPNINHKRFLASGGTISLKIEAANLPFKDIRVRHALMMATDFESLKNDLYEGEAEIMSYVVLPSYTWLHVPMEKMPKTVQELYKYNPEKAKQLLAEAGYPQGFKTKMIVENTSSATDPAAAYKAMWAKVGVDVEIQPRDRVVYSSINTARSWEEMIMGTSGGGGLITSVMTLSGWRGTGVAVGWSDPVVDKAYAEIMKHVFKNQPKADELFREVVPHLYEQAYHIPRPAPYSYTFWQPWVKDYYGELQTYYRWPIYVWIDQDLKEKMTGRR